MARSGASKGAKKIKPFDEQDTKLAMGGFVKRVGEPISVGEMIQGLKIIDDTETNPLKKQLRQKRMGRSNPLKGV